MTTSEIVGVWVARIVGSGIIAASAWVLLRFARGDRSRGRRRCPKCWYELGISIESLRCPECGFAARDEAMLLRTRRRLRTVVLAVLLLLPGVGILLAPRVYRDGWPAVVPGPVLSTLVPYVGKDVARRAVDELHARSKDDLAAWVTEESRFVIAHGNADGDNLGRLATWLMMLRDDKQVDARDVARVQELAAEAAVRMLVTIDPLGASGDIEQAAQVLQNADGATQRRASRLLDWLLGLGEEEFAVASGPLVSALWESPGETSVFTVWADGLDGLNEQGARRTLKATAQVRSDHGAMIRVLRRWAGTADGDERAVWRRAVAEEFLPVLARRNSGGE